MDEIKYYIKMLKMTVNEFDPSDHKSILESQSRSDQKSKHTLGLHTIDLLLSASKIKLKNTMLLFFM
jgi:hypothetical protein